MICAAERILDVSLRQQGQNLHTISMSVKTDSGYWHTFDLAEYNRQRREKARRLQVSFITVYRIHEVSSFVETM